MQNKAIYEGIPDNLSVEYDGIYHEKSKSRTKGNVSMKTMTGKKPLHNAVSEERFTTINKFPSNLS